MLKDIRGTGLYQEAEALYESIRRPGSGQVSDAGEIHPAPNGKHAVFTGTFVDKLEGAPWTRICQIDLISGDTRVLTFGPNADRLPKYSPDGSKVAFLSDRRRAGDFQLYILELASGAAQATPSTDGWVEYFHWSPDGRRILLGIAGYGADVAGVQGAVTSERLSEGIPSWVPTLETGEEVYRWRRAWVYEFATNSVRKISKERTNVWEAVWCGNEALAAVISPGPGEGLWYNAGLHIVEVETGNSRAIYTPKDQLGWPAANCSGRQLAVVEAICSDRWFVAGDLLLIDTASGVVHRVDTHGIDITYAEWRAEQRLLLAGQRGFESVVALFDASSGVFSEIWSSRELTTAGLCVSVSGVQAAGDCVLLAESFVHAPEIAVIRQGQYSPVKSLNLGSVHRLQVNEVEQVGWRAPDGLEMQGWLLRPDGHGPYPLILNVHGGPVWQWRPRWLGRAAAYNLMLLRRGYAIFLPNPRGSTGRGQEFARQVVGDMGGADTHDYLSGLDHLVERGIADPRRLGVTGVSYGGFMTAWLTTQDPRFAAAVPVAPVTNWVTEHMISNIPHWVTLFLEDNYDNPGGKYFQRSPVMYAHKVKTPMLIICGGLDRCTPAEEAVQFHSALLQHGVRSVLVTYPEEGHGVRKFPAAIDYAARIVSWFEEHMPATVAD